MRKAVVWTLFAVLLTVCTFTSCKKKTVELTVTDDFGTGVGALSTEEIWETDDRYTLVNEMGYYLIGKSDFGESMDKLSASERVICIVYELEGEVNNGGFSQYFFNSSGNNGAELVSAFEAIGAKKNAEICRKAVSVFGDDYPKDRVKRQDIMLADENTSFGEVWSECDSAFFEYPEDTAELMYKFISENKDDFN